MDAGVPETLEGTPRVDDVSLAICCAEHRQGIARLVESDQPAGIFRRGIWQVLPLYMSSGTDGARKSIGRSRIEVNMKVRRGLLERLEEDVPDLVGHAVGGCDANDGLVTRPGPTMRELDDLSSCLRVEKISCPNDVLPLGGGRDAGQMKLCGRHARRCKWRP
jgi:hypothetical protein